MPTLTNPRHELFSQARARGAKLLQAQEAAGYALDYGNASRLTRNDKVRQRVRELQQAGAKDVQITVASLVARADHLRQLAIENRQISAAVAAIKEVGILTGLRIDRREVGAPGEFEHLSDEELAAWITAQSAKLDLGNEA
jgi:hypothetical protein